ncbi:E3 ubiquitin-protein ligase RNF14, partial [Orchesella cincta]
RSEYTGQFKCHGTEVQAKVSPRLFSSVSQLRKSGAGNIAHILATRREEKTSFGLNYLSARETTNRQLFQLLLTISSYIISHKTSRNFVTKVMSSNDEEAQQDEILAMESIFAGDDFQAHPGEIRSGLIKIKVDLPDPFFVCVKNENEDEEEEKTRPVPAPMVPGVDNGVEIRYKIEYMPPLMLHFTMPKNYPSQAKPNFTLSANWLHRAALTILCQKLDDLWEENKGMGILFTWANFLQENTLANLGITNFYDVAWLHRPANLSKKNPFRSPRKEGNSTPGDLTHASTASGDLPNGSAASGPIPHGSRASGDLANNGSTASGDTTQGSTSGDLAMGSTASNDVFSANTTSADLPNGSTTAEDFITNPTPESDEPSKGSGSCDAVTYSSKTSNATVTSDDVSKASTSSSVDVNNIPSTSRAVTNHAPTPDADVETTSMPSAYVSGLFTTSGEVGNTSTTSCVTEETEDEYDEDSEFQMAQNVLEELAIGSGPSQPKAEAKKPRRKYVRKRANRRRSVVLARPLFDSRAASDQIPLRDAKKLSLQEFLLMHNDEQIRETFMMSSHNCDICFTMKSGQVCVRFRCGHVYCQDCTTEFFTTNIIEGNVDNVKCLGYKCKMRPTPELVKLLVKDELYERYDQILLKRALENMADVTYCPRPKCHNPVICETNEKCALCTACGYTFCSTCKMVYHGVEPCRFKDADMKDVFKKYTEGTADEKKAMRSSLKFSWKTCCLNNGFKRRANLVLIAKFLLRNLKGATKSHVSNATPTSAGFVSNSWNQEIPTFTSMTLAHRATTICSRTWRKKKGQKMNGYIICWKMRILTHLMMICTSTIRMISITTIRFDLGTPKNMPF